MSSIRQRSLPPLSPPASSPSIFFLLFSLHAHHIPAHHILPQINKGKVRFTIYKPELAHKSGFQLKRQTKHKRPSKPCKFEPVRDRALDSTRTRAERGQQQRNRPASAARYPFRHSCSRCCLPRLLRLLPHGCRPPPRRLHRRRRLPAPSPPPLSHAPSSSSPPQPYWYVRRSLVSLQHYCTLGEQSLTDPVTLVGLPPFAGRRPFPVVRAAETDATKDGESTAARAAIVETNGRVVCFDPFFNSLSLGLPLLLLMRVVASVAQRSPRPRRRRRRRRTAPASTSCSASRAPSRRP
jgi:hypothetical protein